MLFAGVDIGSTTTKCVIIDEEGQSRAYVHIMTEFNRDVSGDKVLKEALKAAGAEEGELGCVISTGYGRKAFKRSDKDIPEIIAHAVGTQQLVPEVRTIIDIGGQDSKVIAIAANGTVDKFEMNDKCAAGTGRFFEVLTHRLLGIEMDELSDLILSADEPVPISSTCTIFAETEIISQLSQNVPIANIASGVGYSIAKRIITQGKGGRIQYLEPIVFSGGVANNEGIRQIFAKLLGKDVIAVGNPQSTAALGAAIWGRNEWLKEAG